MRRKIPIVKQSSYKDCGPAALLSIIKYYHGYVPLEKIKLDCKTDNNGSNFYNIIKASNKYGFDAEGLKCLDDESLYKIKLPAICQTLEKNRSHFVVLYEVKNNKVVIMDPYAGKKVISLEYFREIFTNNYIEFYPRSKIILLNKENKIFNNLIEIMKLEKKLFFKLVFTSINFTIVTVISSYYFKIAIDSINEDINYLKMIFLFFLLIYLLKIVFRYTKDKYELHLNKNLDIYLYRNFLEHLFFIPSRAIELKKIGEIINRINDVGLIKNLYSDILVSLFLDSFLMVIAIPLLYSISNTLFMILFLVLILYLIIGIIFSKVIYNKIIVSKEYEDEFQTDFIENITLYKNIKNLNKTKFVLKKIENSLSKFIYINFEIEKINNIQNGSKNFITEIGFYTINTVGVYNILKNNITVTDLITFNTLMSFFLEPIKNLINNIPKYNFVRASIYKLNEFMNIDLEKNGKTEVIDKFDISLNNVSFGYNEYKNVIENISLKIYEKDHILIKGKSGSGKSTICKLITKKEEEFHGEITINSININDINLNTIRSNVVYISQKEYLYSDTVKNNLLFYNEISLKKLTDICKICKVDEILKQKSLSYDSFIEMDSNNLSGGEKQRIVLARACLNVFKVLIIDEALSELDYETELKIISGIRKYFKDKTIIYVSHKNVDKAFEKVYYVK